MRASAQAAPERPASEAQLEQDQSADPIQFEADRVEYNDNSDEIAAKGNVVLRRQGQSLRADSVRWNQKTGEIAAEGNIRLVDEDHDIDCKIDGFGAMKLKSEFVKKA